ncbi:hypothetical protein EV356DRAFT_278327 [Viridothelium virens]|uniref:Uncharacterized protein n=1 Tax=Viridothelium virens TaxID=1048519 RepID=A0A6A6H1R4_VIRVR|nr:hypothetical protein EV356DRAFT_278327 [Viridothelium virens]
MTLTMARQNPQYTLGSEAHSLRSSPSFHGRQVTPQTSQSRLRSPVSLPCSPQPSSSAALRFQEMTTSPTRTPGAYAASPPSTSSSTPSGTGARSLATSPWDESQQRRLERVTSYSAARHPSHSTTPSRTHSEELQQSDPSQQPFHFRHKLKTALKDFFKRDAVDEGHDCQKLQDTHWTD